MWATKTAPGWAADGTPMVYGRGGWRRVKASAPDCPEHDPAYCNQCAFYQREDWQHLVHAYCEETRS